MLLVLAWVSAALKADPVPEAALKAAYIYNFALFVSWPVAFYAGDAHFNLCVAPTSPLRPALLRLQDKPAHERPIAVLSAPAGSAHCQVLVLDAGDAGVPPADQPGVLTVADGPGAQAAVITLEVVGDRLRFDVDTQAAGRAQLDLSSQLLRLARNVR